MKKISIFKRLLLKKLSNTPKLNNIANKTKVKFLKSLLFRKRKIKKIAEDLCIENANKIKSKNQKIDILFRFSRYFIAYKATLAAAALRTRVKDVKNIEGNKINTNTETSNLLYLLYENKEQKVVISDITTKNKT